jgi:hypothetical protein
VVASRRARSARSERGTWWRRRLASWVNLFMIPTTPRLAVSRGGARACGAPPAR